MNTLPEPVLEETSARRLNGHLHLVCDADSRGETRLRHQSFRAPIHLSKPHRDQGCLVLNIANPTAGFFEGDRLAVDVSVERGARLLLTSPGANRIHAMDAGCATVRQRLRVAGGGSLETWPELLIPQRGSRYRQHTTIELEPGAELLFFERLAPGRTAMGEIFAFAELRLETDLYVAGRLLLRERSRLVPGGRMLEALRRRFPSAYYAGAILSAPALHPHSACWQALHEQQDGNTWIGTSSLGGNSFVLKIIASDSLTLRRALVAARETVYSALGRKVPGLRRI